MLVDAVTVAAVVLYPAGVAPVIVIVEPTGITKPESGVAVVENVAVAVTPVPENAVGVTVPLKAYVPPVVVYRPAVNRLVTDTVLGAAPNRLFPLLLGVTVRGLPRPAVGAPNVIVCPAVETRNDKL